MYTKILLFVIILILSAFFYLHLQNPTVVSFKLTDAHTYVVPVALVAFAGFFAGVLVSVLNSLVVDARRAIKDLKTRREKKAVQQAEESYRKGVELLFKGDTAQARSNIERAIRLNPSDEAMLISLAETYIRENRPDDALKALESSGHHNPSSIETLVAIARCRAEAGDDSGAERAFDEVLRFDPKNPIALKNLRDIKARSMDWMEAVALQKKIIERETGQEAKAREKEYLSGLLYESSSRFADQGKTNEAIAGIKEILKNDQSFMPAHILLGEILYRQGNVSNAVKVWEKACGRYSNTFATPLYLKLEDLYLRESAPDKILERYKKEIKAYPNDTNLRLLLSRLYLRLEMVDNAIDELERLHQESEDAFYTQTLLAEAYLRRKQSVKAAHLFQKALGLDRDFIPPFKCSSCSFDGAAWSARCPSCGEWNTLKMNNSYLGPGRLVKDSAPATAIGNAVPFRRQAR